jgi:predicted DCC family thiol-disulfide oxidoreductase YuxK
MHDNVIIFDGECILCSSFVQFVLKRDKNALYKFTPLQSDIGREQLFKRDINADNVETVFLLKDERVLEKSEAVIRILTGLGGLWKSMNIFLVIPKTLRDWLYAWIAANRVRFFGKRDSCFVPTAEMSSRFLT